MYCSGRGRRGGPPPSLSLLLKHFSLTFFSLPFLPFFGLSAEEGRYFRGVKKGGESQKKEKQKPLERVRGGNILSLSEAYRLSFKGRVG